MVTQRHLGQGSLKRRPPTAASQVKLSTSEELGTSHRRVMRLDVLRTLFIDERGAHNPPYDLQKYPFFARLSSKGAVTSTMHHPTEEVLALLVKKQIVSSLQLQLQGNRTSESYVRACCIRPS